MDRGEIDMMKWKKKELNAIIGEYKYLTVVLGLWMQHLMSIILENQEKDKPTKNIIFMIIGRMLKLENSEEMLEDIISVLDMKWIIILHYWNENLYLRTKRKNIVK